MSSVNLSVVISHPTLRLAATEQTVSSSHAERSPSVGGPHQMLNSVRTTMRQNKEKIAVFAGITSACLVPLTLTVLLCLKMKGVIQLPDKAIGPLTVADLFTLVMAAGIFNYLRDRQASYDSHSDNIVENHHFYSHSVPNADSNIEPLPRYSPQIQSTPNTPPPSYQLAHLS